MRPSRRLAAIAALALACLFAAVPPVAAVDWCLPRIAAEQDQPCPDPKQCCAVWGLCGTGTHYCKQGHCAGGACQGIPVLPPKPVYDAGNQFSVTDDTGGIAGSGGNNPFDLSAPPVPSATPPSLTPSTVQIPSCGFVQQDIDVFGADLPNGTVSRISTFAECCGACKARKGCDAYTFVAQDQRCYLKSSIRGFEVRVAKGLQSAIKPVVGTPPTTPTTPTTPTPSPTPSPTPPLSPTPSPSPSPTPVQPTCGAVQPDVDLFGGDLPSGTVVDVASVEACCSTCKGRSGCGAFTYVPWLRLCYLKGSNGLTVKTRAGMQSVVMAVPTPGASPPPTPAAPTPGTPVGPYKFEPLNEEQKRRMYQLTSIFENADTTLQYGYAERLYDSRGITYGFCGFTTGTADGLMVVEEYTRLKPINPLARFLPALRAVAMRGDSFGGLDGFEAEVKKLANDQEFIKAQWTVCDAEYHEPAMKWCQKVNCRLAITKAQLHDALVNHGEGLGEKFSVDYIFQAAEKAAGGNPATGVDEQAWLKAFLQARRDLLYNWDRVARVSVKRIDIYRKLLDLGNLNMDGPIYIDLVKHTSPDGKTVWQVQDTYYGTFLVYNDPPDPNHKLALVV